MCVFMVTSYFHHSHHEHKEQFAALFPIVEVIGEDHPSLFRLLASFSSVSSAIPLLNFRP